MIIEHPPVVALHAPAPRRPAGAGAGIVGGAAITETFRPLDDPGQRAGARQGERNDAAEHRPRSDAEWAARMRVGVAREQARQSGDTGAQDRAWQQGGTAGRETYISAAETRRLRERLEARLAPDPEILILPSVDLRA
ncbi:hypothetical protein [Thioalkalivibrio sp.]|uniref:hypothetical protein n=1 Tax=Thioalkalivibrio sp. TaxID=2093813 RepID=UPI00356B55C2